MLFSALLVIATGVGGCEWTISDREIHMDVSFWQFLNNPPNSASVTDTMVFLMIIHSTCTGQFSRGIVVIGVLDFGMSKKFTCSDECH